MQLAKCSAYLNVHSQKKSLIVIFTVKPIYFSSSNLWEVETVLCQSTEHIQSTFLDSWSSEKLFARGQAKE